MVLDPPEIFDGSKKVDELAPRLSAYDPALAEATLTGDGDDEIAVIARLSDPDALPEGVRVVTRFGDVATLRLRRARLVELADSDCVTAVEAVRRLRPSTDPEDADSEYGASDADDEVALATSEAPTSSSYTRKPAGTTGTGKGVVVGVLDWGCDFAHPAFRHKDGSTRLLAVWDQRGEQGTEAGNRWGYGRILAASDIKRALGDADPYGALDYDPSDSGARKGAHGTHVLDIAAGNGRGGGMVGVAPEADLVFVHLSRTTKVLGKGNLGDSATVLEALDFVFSTAGDRPCVVNMSVGAHGGPHDGTTLVEQGIDRAVSLEGGRAVVNSAGNYFAKRAHTQGRVETGAENVLRFSVPSGDPTDSELEVWYPGVDRVTATVIDPTGAELASVSPGQDASLAIGGEVVGHIYHHARQSINGDHHIDLFLKAEIPDGSWQLRLRGDAVQDGHYHAWVERDRGLRPTFVASDVVRTSTTGTLCNGTLSITVGAYDPHEDQGALPIFSSAGPTRDGRVKPEIVAPGVHIRAARSTPPGESPSARYISKSGTSMAAPHVAGTVALMFEAAGTGLRIFDTRALLFATADPALFAGGVPTGSDLHRYGNGYLDIVAAETAAREWAREEANVEQADEAVPAMGSALGGASSTPTSFRDALLGTLTTTHGVQSSDQLRQLALSAMGVHADAELVPVARPTTFLAEPVRPGDLLVRSTPSEGVLHSAVVISEEAETPADLTSRGVPVELAGAGACVEVVEVPFGGGSARFVGRRLTDSWGRVPRGQELLRPTEVPPSGSGRPLENRAAPDSARSAVPPGTGRRFADGQQRGGRDQQPHPVREHIFEVADPAQEERPPRKQYPGVRVKRLKDGTEAAVVDMSKLGERSIAALARLFHLPRQRAFRELIRRRGNRHVVRALHRQTIFARYPGLAQARLDLQQLVRNRPRYYLRHWVVPVDLSRPIVLPATDAFKRDFGIYQAWVERENRRRELRPALQRVKTQVRRIGSENSQLEQDGQSLKALLQDRVRDLATLEMLQHMLAVMVRFPSETPGRGDASDVKEFRSRLDGVHSLARDLMVENPTGYEFWSDGIKKHSRRIWQLVDNRTLADHMQIVARHWDLVDERDRREIEDTFLKAYQLLLTSPLEGTVVARHLEPLLQAIGADYTPPANLPNGLSSGFSGALAQTIAAPDRPTAVAHLAMAAGLGSRTVANLPGPNAFAVSLLRVVGPAVIGPLGRDAAAAGRLGGVVYRALVNVARLSPKERAQVLFALAQRNPQGLKDARDVLSGKVPPRLIGGVLVLLNMAAMLNVWQSSEELTLKQWSDLLASGIGAGLGTARLLASVERLRKVGVIRSLSSGSGGKFLGGLGGVLAVYSGIETAVQEYGSGDVTGTIIAGVDVVAGGLSVAGFLMMLGAANAWNGVGEVLMLVGAVVGLVTFVWSSLRDYFTAGPKRVAEGMLEHFRRNAGSYDMLLFSIKDYPREAQQRIRRLEELVKALVTKLHDTDFWDIHSDGIISLLDLAFCPPHIEVLTKLDEDDVLSRLRRQNRWDDTDRRLCGQGG